MKIQEEVRKNPHIFKIEEIRKKEVTMDINQQKEPEIAWKFPHKIKLESDIELELNEEGKESQEKKYIQDFCDGQLRVRYFDEIPEPLEKEKMAIMFSFTDENIVKLLLKRMMSLLKMFQIFGIIFPKKILLKKIYLN